jgi:hypothetical protein
MRYRHAIYIKSHAPALTLVSVLGASLLSGAASASNEVSLRVSTSFLADSGYYAISENRRLTQAEVSYARALFHPQRGLWVEASWIVGSSSEPLFGTDLELKGLFNAVTAGIRYTHPIKPWIVPCARTGVGIMFGSLQARGNAAQTGGVTTEVSDRTAGLTAYLLAGVQFLIPRRFLYLEERRGITGGLVIEGGVTATTGLGFDLAPEQDEELRNIPLSGSGVGSLAITGGVVRAGLLLRF